MKPIRKTILSRLISFSVVWILLSSISVSQAEFPNKLRLEPFSLLLNEQTAENADLDEEPQDKEVLSIDLDEILTEKNTNDADSAPGITILKVVDYRENNQLKIDSQSRFSIGTKQISAINHGIPIKFKTEILLTEKSSFLGFPYQRTRKHVRYLTELTSYGINRQYVLFNNRNDKLQRFATIDRALETMGTLEAFEIAHLKELHPTQKYRLRMRIFLDYWTLPAPLLLEALLDPNWRLDSGWFEVNLTTPLSWQ